MNNLDQNINENSIRKCVTALSSLLVSYKTKEIDLERMARVAVLIIKSGGSKYSPILAEVANLSLKQQKKDGGWIGVEDSAWSVAVLKEYKEHSQAYNRGLDWIKEQQLPSGSWGKTNRDFGRITVTAIALFLLPELSTEGSLRWLEEEWKKEFSLNSKLTYKCAFSLMAIKEAGYQFTDSALFDNSLKWLENQQNEEQGWGPFKGHPVGSTPFCTGIALTGLLQHADKVDRNVIANGLKWIERNQLEDGLWADHYIEEGSAWCFYALTEGYKFLKGSQ